MGIAKQQIQELETLCHKFRKDIIDVLYKKQTGHPGGSLSACEILTSLYFYSAKVNSENPKMEDRDRIILCKGHAAPMLYRVLAEKGFFPVEEMDTLRDLNTNLQGHPCCRSTPGVEISTGPLGIGLSASLGIALALRQDNNGARVYAILGDGELNEGTVWEACMAAAKFKADNLTAILDWNGVQLDGTADEIMPLGDVKAKFDAFGWNCVECDGHNIGQVCDALDQAKEYKGKPTIILARTIKGKGVSFMEGKSAWHGKPIGEAEYKQAMQELGGIA